MNSNFKNKALTKLLIYWKEERGGRSVQTFYSLDKEQDLKKKNHLPGVYGLRKRLVAPNRGKFHIAIIYDNLNPNSKELFRFNDKGDGC